MEKRKKLEQQIIEKAMKDPDFRKRLLDNPKAVLKEETGVELPAFVNLRIFEEDPQTVYLILPSVPAEPDTTELAETELEMIAGGRADSLLCTVFGCPPPGDPGG